MEEEAKKYLWWGIPIVVVAGLAAALYYGRKHKEEPPVAEQVQPAPVATAPDRSANYPIDDGASTAAPLPALGESDAAVHDSLSGLFGKAIDQFLVPKDIVRHVVVTIDNLPRKKTSVQMWPVQPTGGLPVVDGQDESLTLSEQNYARYAPIMALVRNTDTRQVAALYKRYYPLFQQAYVELGYPEAYFNNRLVEVIDHLLQTPEVTGPVRLKQPGVFYEFADASLEERSAGQKLLLRMGPTNAATIKMKLRELRREVANQSAG
ncbi:MAG TPA: DUF3014 domain-containing protein [Povalibacter sp.]|uniref:DUF3014 domain-containing protein n=1 Tax=Povalibacter sp. TaxID=1962978 RepID=UPI002CE9AC96|nr:DUF3014 domain-containing protein [Povalibacter sp.]HMN46595.1 DUF3014 domain-containing protein [Povalibacter sp.]